MSFTSNLGNLPIIDDANFIDVVNQAETDPEKGRGLVPRDFTKQPFGSLGFAAPFDIPVIPRDEWVDRIEEGERTKSRISDFAAFYKLKVKFQASTNYCWINAPVRCVELKRAVQGQPFIDLSPASCGAIIKNFRNVGGWGTEGVKFLAEHGAVPSSMWPANAIDRRYNTEAANAERVKYRVDEWWELQPRNFDQLATCLLLNIPVAVGLNWWGHEVTFESLVKLDGRDQYGVLFANSWGEQWGDKGYGVLTGNKMLPDDAIAPRVVTAS